MNQSPMLPQGWQEKTFGDVVLPVSVNEKKLPRGDYLESGKYPVVDQGQRFIGGYSNDGHRVISEDLPLLVFGDHTRAFKYLDQPFIPGADGVKVLKPNGVNAKWLYQIAHALEFPDKGYARHFQHLKSARLLVPPPDEQVSIVAEIEKQFTRLEAGVAALRRVQANLKRYRAAVLKAACEGRLVPTEAELARSEGRLFESGQQLLARILTERRQNWQGRGKYKEPDAPNTANLQLLPEDWTWASVEQIGRIETGSTPPKAETANYGDEVPLVKPGELLDHPVGEAADNLTRQGAAVATTAPAESVLVSCIGNLGKTALAVREVAFNQQINAIIPALTRTARWIFYAVQQRAFRQQLESVASATTISIVNKSKFSALIIPLPPLAEQTRIVAEVERRLSVVEELEAVVTTSLQRATRLRQSILQKAFSGELT